MNANKELELLRKEIELLRKEIELLRAQKDTVRYVPTYPMPTAPLPYTAPPWVPYITWGTTSYGDEQIPLLNSFGTIGS